MLRFCTARLIGIDAKYASYSFVQECTILANSNYLKSATKKMKEVDIKGPTSSIGMSAIYNSSLMKTTYKAKEKGRIQQLCQHTVKGN